MRAGDEPQNVHDNPQFLAGYSQMDQFGDGWERAMEHVDFAAGQFDLVVSSLAFHYVAD